MAGFADEIPTGEVVMWKDEEDVSKSERDLVLSIHEAGAEILSIVF